MSVLLPQPRLPQKAVPRLIDAGGIQQGGPGGVAQRLNRLGNRFALDIAYPRLKPEPDGRILAARVRKAVVEGALFPFPQPGLNIGTPGSPVVNGAGQTGSGLSLRGFAAGYAYREGQFFSIIIASRRFLYQASADGAADGSGNAFVPILPMIRVPPADGSICEFAQPYIEGFITAGAAEIEQTIAKSMIPQITITERA